MRTSQNGTAYKDEAKRKKQTRITVIQHFHGKGTRRQTSLVTPLLFLCHTMQCYLSVSYYPISFHIIHHKQARTCTKVPKISEAETD